MKENVGQMDRIVRGIAGPALVVAGAMLLGKNRWAGLVAVVAGAMIGETAVTRVCPINEALNIDTRGDTEKGYDLSALPKEPPQALLPQA